MAISTPSSRRLLSEASPSIGSKERSTDSPRSTSVTLRAQAGEDAGQLHGDVAAADHGHALRPLGQQEEAVGGQAELRARDARHRRAGRRWR